MKGRVRFVGVALHVDEELKRWLPLVSVHPVRSGLPRLLEQREKHLERATLMQRMGHASREMENLTGLDFILLTADRDAHRALNHEHRGVVGRHVFRQALALGKGEEGHDAPFVLQEYSADDRAGLIGDQRRKGRRLRDRIVHDWFHLYETAAGITNAPE